LAGKRLELLREILPGLSRVAVLWNAANPYSTRVFGETEHVAAALKIEVQSLEVRSPDDFDSALDNAIRQNANGLITIEDPLTGGHSRKIAAFAAKNKLPTLFGVRQFVDAGGLVSYGANLADLSRQAAGYVDKILKGAKPADMPVEQPTKFELIVNLKTAKALSSDIPPTLLARADEVIE
jgi:putative ABC transport system substrate-binding protein